MTPAQARFWNRVFGALWLALGALLVGMILAAPVMREPAKAAPKTHTEWVCHTDREQFPDGPADVEKCNQETFVD